MPPADVPFPPDFTQAPETLPAMIRHRAALSADRVALIDGTTTWTYRALLDAIDDTAGWLRTCAIRPGDRVILICENGRAATALLFGLLEIGAWPILLSARVSEPELAQIRAHSGARRTLYTIDAAPRARAHATRDGAQIIDRTALGPTGLGPLQESAVAEVEEAPAPRRLAALVYTSGTTGQPKGVMLTHRNLLFVAAASGRVRGLVPEDRVYALLPVSHILGLTGVLLSSLMFGAALYPVGRFDPAATLAALERNRVSFILGTPGLYALLVEYAARNQINQIAQPALRLLSTAGAPLDQPTKDATERLFGRPLYNGYGITECGPTVALTPLDAPRADCGVGQLLAGIEAKLVAPAGTALQPDEPGELWLRGPGVMRGYYRAPAETASVLNADGWFNTRDLARLEDGDLFIVGRTRELIIRYGFNVYPAEIEAVLNGHPAVALSAVVARATESGEEIVGFVQLISGASVTPEALLHHAAHRLAAYKHPSRIVILEALPVTPAGKVRKQALTELARGL